MYVLWYFFVFIFLSIIEFCSVNGGLGIRKFLLKMRSLMCWCIVVSYWLEIVSCYNECCGVFFNLIWN